MSSLSKKYADKVSAKDEKSMEKLMKEQKENKGSYKEVPSGEYPVVIDKLELAETTWGDEQISIWFKITDGEYKNGRLFYNGAFNDNFSNGIAATAVLLADLLDDDDLSSAKVAAMLGLINDDHETVSELVADIAEETESMAYDLDYEVKESKKTNPNTGKPYINKTFEITGVYDV